MNRPDHAAWIATARFGLGARGDAFGRARRDPRGWVQDQLVPVAVPAALAALPDTQTTVAEFFASRRQGDDAKRAARRGHRSLYRAEAAARARQAATTAHPVHERLVRFWSNHFTVSVDRNQVTGIVGSFEREAIRPHVLGRFEELLLSVVRHPAMLLYLDNARSIGPDSRAGQRRERGLNENLAREILELHTLGVDGGYRQDDVQALAGILTGWSVGRDAEAGAFSFAWRRHQPGPKTLLGVRYGEGLDEGERALRALARHPSTARFVARALGTHFAADVPPAALVDRLARVYLDSEGDLRAVMTALVADPAVWADPGAKIRGPADLVIACARAVPRLAEDDGALLGGLRHLGRMPWSAPSPAGWSDRAEDLVGPESVVRRIEWAERLGHRFGADTDALTVAERTLPTLQRGTRSLLASAASPAEALALVFASPAFLRR